jgi:ankyrin repeat protein
VHVHRHAQEALWGVATQGYESVVRLLLARSDVDLNVEDERGETPLSLAVRIGQDSIVGLLLAWTHYSESTGY